MDLTTAITNLLSAPVLAFALGLLVVAVRSDLRVPEAVSQGLSIYLLLAIGLKGGVAIRSTEVTTLVVPLVLAIGLGIVIPIAAFCVLTPFDPVDRGAIAAHYGSTSLVTFTAALLALETAAITVPAYAATMLTIMEIPGIIVGLLLARRHSDAHIPWAHTVHEIVTGKSVFLLVGGLALGAIIGEPGYATISPLFTDLFRGALVLFLLGLGIEAGTRLPALRHGAGGLIVFALIFPPAVGALAVTAGSLAGLDIGGAAILGVLCGSASYIAAPAAIRMSLPNANIAYPLTASLAVTFPFNLVVGIPLLVWLATELAG